MLRAENTALIVIDVQGKLAQLMDGKEALFESLVKMIRGAQILGGPIFWNEQLPEKLGPTIPEVAALLAPALRPMAKSSFSCCGNPVFMEALQKTGRSQVLLAGIEAHVCVYQTCLELLELKYEVQLVADAISSRTAENRALAFERMRGAGATVTGVEMALFELQRVGEGAQFKELLKIIK